MRTSVARAQKQSARKQGVRAREEMLMRNAAQLSSFIPFAGAAFVVAPLRCSNRHRYPRLARQQACMSGFSTTLRTRPFVRGRQSADLRRLTSTVSLREI